jgi:hypothetical protein
MEIFKRLASGKKPNNHLKLTRRASAPHNLGRRYVLKYLTF